MNPGELGRSIKGKEHWPVGRHAHERQRGISVKSKFCHEKFFRDIA